MKIFIAGSSNNTIPPKYLDDCKDTLETILKDNDLIFGVSKNGIMGIAYEIAKKNNRKVYGICPEAYRSSLNGLTCDKTIITNTIVESTNIILEESDLIIVFPGGIGTLFELYFAIQSKICNEHNKPIILYNSHRYFDSQIEDIKEKYLQNFVNKPLEELIHITNTKEDIEKELLCLEKD